MLYLKNDFYFQTQKKQKTSKYIKKKTNRSKSVPAYTNQPPILMDTIFPTPVQFQRSISTESVTSNRTQDIFEKRATRKLSLLSLPSNLTYLEELGKSNQDMNANRKGSFY